MGTADDNAPTSVKSTNHDRNQRTKAPGPILKDDPQHQVSGLQTDLDDFGLPRRKPQTPHIPIDDSDEGEDDDTFHDASASVVLSPQRTRLEPSSGRGAEDQSITSVIKKNENLDKSIVGETTYATVGKTPSGPESRTEIMPTGAPKIAVNGSAGDKFQEERTKPDASDLPKDLASTTTTTSIPEPKHSKSGSVSTLTSMPIYKTEKPDNGLVVSDWSHQKLAPKDEAKKEEEEEQWQAMPAIDEFDIFDDDGRLVAKGVKVEDDDIDKGYQQFGRKGYTKVQLDEDARSANSVDEDTDYLFKPPPVPKKIDDEEEEEDDDLSVDEEYRDHTQQLEATKDLLTEGQRIAYVGIVRLLVYKMYTALDILDKTKSTKKEMVKACETMEIWGQGMMLRLYAHMEINAAEQLMIEQLAEHGVQPGDLTAPLMQNARVKNPMADDKDLKTGNVENGSTKSSRSSSPTLANDVPEIHGPEAMPNSKQIDLDLRWTVLCDLFLLLLADGVYDARSRRLLERVASSMQITWLQICRFEKRIVEAIELQEDEMKEQHDESQNMEKRRKMGLRRKYMFMGLATVGGGLVIGLSAGLLAPLIGAGMAAGFTTLGVTGTAGFFAGAGGAALITSAATVTGGTIAVRASDRRTGHVKTFEYRPLHNNKRPNLILTISGWMTGKVDDVRLPFSTVDPIMGDIYSLLWEPEMLRSMGDTINILATEALTQTVQQVLGSTILVALMASIQLPVVLTKLAYLIDNPWSVSLDRAHSAGLILADSLIDRHLGQRPITLLGFSLGARVIFSCLMELSARGAYGIIQNVYLFGSPVVAKRDDYLRARSVIAGRFVNGYASSDWILGYLFRATSGGIMRVAGLAPVENVPGLENLDVSKLVNGHMAYRAAMPRLLQEVGWEVESLEFTEIEDPDPEDHAKRQRELIREIDEARKKASELPEKKRFGLFKRGKLAEKKGWETYDPNKVAQKKTDTTNDGTPPPGLEANVLFDIEAIRKELAGEMIEVREIDSTLPPLQITSIKNGEKHVEYLRLPPGMTPEEVQRMNLPPRPDEVDVGPAKSTKRWSTAFSRSKPNTPVVDQSPRFSEPTYEEPKELPSTLPPLSITPSFTPKEFSSTNSSPIHPPHTRPPLQSYGSTGNDPDRRDSASSYRGVNSRPTLQTFTSSPAITSARKNSWVASREGSPSPARNSEQQDRNGRSHGPGANSSLSNLSLEHNAWADEGDGEVQLTFE